MTSSESSKTSFLETICAHSGTKRDKRNERKFTAWCFIWAVCYTGAHWLLKSDHVLAAPIIWSLVIVPNVISIIAVFAYARYLRMADELVQKIQLQGLAFGFAGGILVTAGYQLFEVAGAPELKTDHILMTMIFGWTAGQLYGHWKYR